MGAPKDPFKYEQWKNNISRGHKGKPWTEKQRESMKNRPPPWNKGKTGVYSKETIERMVKPRIGKPNLKLRGRIFSNKTLKLMSLAKQDYVPWNSGKKGVQISWCKGLTKENCESLRKISEKAKGRIFNQEWRDNLSKASKGKPKSEAWMDSMKNWKTPYFDTKPERMMQISLALNGIKFLKQKSFKLGKKWHKVDIFIEPNICLEVDGVIWHIPINRIKRDLRQTQELTIMGYHVIRIRDKDILNNTQGCAEKVIQLIKELQHRHIPLG